MTKQELFEKYSINETHNVWDNRIDNWISVELYRIMHDGNLPPPDDVSVKYVTEFLDKIHERKEFFIQMKNTRKDYGSLYLTAKRMVYSLADNLLSDEAV